jgi:tetratricopeptide (TPR) repeat protein
MTPATTKATILLFLLATAFAVQAQTAGKRPPPPALLKLLPNGAGDLTVATPFSLRLSKPGFPETEVAIKPEIGALRIVCTWEPSTPLLISVTAAAGHGLPGRIGLASETGQSPVTIQVQVAHEQVARGPVYVEISGSPLQRGGAGVVRGTVLASMTAGATEELDDQVRVRTAVEEGKLLSPSEVNAMEAKLKSDSHDWSARLSLLAYYSSSAGLRMSKAQIVAARRRHILWVIENRATATDMFDMPELQMENKGPLNDPDGAREAEAAWQRAIAEHAQNKQVLLNAALFSVLIDPAFSERTLLQAKSHSEDDNYCDLVLGWLYATAMVSGTDRAFAEHAHDILTASNDAPMLAGAASRLAWPQPTFSTTPQPWIQISRPKYIGMAEELASRAISAAPANPYWLLPLLQVLSVEVETSETADQKLVAEKKVYGLFQHFNDIAVDPAARTLLLPLLADLAFDVKDNEAAKKYATQALDLASEHGDRTIQGIAVGPAAIHDANDVLGRIALHSGDMQEAKAYLLKAAAPSGANTMGRVGPRMLLAQMLFDQGEREVVLQYLQNLKTSWKSGSFLLDHWIAAIRLGKSVRLNHVDTPILGLPQR